MADEGAQSSTHLTVNRVLILSGSLGYYNWAEIAVM